LRIRSGAPSFSGKHLSALSDVTRRTGQATRTPEGALAFGSANRSRRGSDRQGLLTGDQNSADRLKHNQRKTTTTCSKDRTSRTPASRTRRRSRRHNDTDPAPSQSCRPHGVALVVIWS
jgi:hypothetical protein